MSGTRLGLPLLLFAAAACAHNPSSQAPKPLKPEDGPRASIRVEYQGGLINRHLQAYFRTESYAYVLVGHLGGDGRIRVLYPDGPDETGFVRGQRSYRTGYVSAHYDGVPSLFSYTISPFRSTSALYDSYDGRGHGYVFLIASRMPLRYGLLYDDVAGWAEWELNDYSHSSDPRQAIRAFADVLAGSAKYTLKYASPMMTGHYASYASRAWDCAFLSSLGMFGYGVLGSITGMPLVGYRLSSANYCDGALYPHNRYSLLHRGPIFTTAAVPPPNPSANPTPGEPAPTLDRPGRRGLGPRADAPARTATLTRVSPTARTDPWGDRETLGRRAGPPMDDGIARPRAGGVDRSDGIDRAERSSSSGRSRPAADRPSSPRDRSNDTRARGASESPRSSGSARSAEPRPSPSTRSSGERSVQSPREVRTSNGKKPDQQ